MTTARRLRRAAAGLTITATLAIIIPTTTSSSASTSTTTPPLTGQHRTVTGGRTYWLSGAGDDLVVGLPGTDLNASSVNAAFWNTGSAATGGWQRHAASHHYVLAIGETLAGNWNVGGGWPGGSQDDVAYLVNVVADAAKAAGHPFHAVFVAGFSAGGAMAWRAVADRPDVFAACGSASGWASYYPAHRVDCWHVHGTADTTVPIRGGAGIHGFVFPPAFYEQSRTTRDSRVVMEAMGGGHGVAGWMADQLWQFWMTLGS